MKATIYHVVAKDDKTKQEIHSSVAAFPATAFRIPRVGECVHHGEMDGPGFHGNVVSVKRVKGRELR